MVHIVNLIHKDYVIKFDKNVTKKPDTYVESFLATVTLKSRKMGQIENCHKNRDVIDIEPSVGCTLSRQAAYITMTQFHQNLSVQSFLTSVHCRYTGDFFQKGSKINPKTGI